MARLTKYSREEAGCYGDGTFGHQHVRAKLAEVLDGLNLTGPEEFNRLTVSGLLRGPGSDDLSEEDEALDILNEHTDDGVVFAFVDGDLLLIGEDQLG